MHNSPNTATANLQQNLSCALYAAYVTTKYSVSLKRIGYKKMPAHKVIVVDDDQDIQSLYKLKLERVGFETKTANDGLLALQIAESFRPDIMLIDLKMPGMDAEQLLSKLRQKDWASNIRLIIMSTYSKSEFPSSLRFYNIDRFIVKAEHSPDQLAEITLQTVVGGQTEPHRRSVY